MPLYVMIGRDGPEGPERRRAHREEHLARLRPLADGGRVRFAGPLLDTRDEPCGSVIVFEADDLEAAREVAARDPYVRRGVFESHEVLATRQVFPSP
ncbi:MAG: YciI family protein [Myxococcota bacterium]